MLGNSSVALLPLPLSCSLSFQPKSRRKVQKSNFFASKFSFPTICSSCLQGRRGAGGLLVCNTNYYAHCSLTRNPSFCLWSYFLLPVAFLLPRSVREHQVGNGGLQPVPGNHLADLGGAVVGELEVRAPGAGLKVQIQIPVQHRRAEAAQRHAVKAGAGVNVEQVVLELLILRGRGRGRGGGGVRAGGGRGGSPPAAVCVPAVPLRRPAQAAAAAARGGGPFLPAARRVLVQAERVAGVRRAAERGAGGDHDGGSRAHAQAGPAAAEHVHPLRLLALGYLLGC